MGAKEWIISLALGFVALPLGALIRLIPNEPCERVFVKVRLLPKPKPEEPTFPPDVESGFAFVVDRVRDNLGTFSKLRGGRMRGSSFVRKSRSAAPDPDGPPLV
jgi:Ca2+-transporting ATPase